MKTARDNSEFIEKAVSTLFAMLILLSNLLSAKMVAWSLLPFLVPAGLFLYPLTFFLNDFVVEVYGKQRARLMVFTAMAMNVLALPLIQLVILLPAETALAQEQFTAVFGFSAIRIGASLAAFFIAQMVDISLYASIKQWTGGKMLWLRSNGSTLSAQAVDTVIVDLFFLYLGLAMPLQSVAAIIAFSLAYKALFSILLTPCLYFACAAFARWCIVVERDGRKESITPKGAVI